MKFLLALVMTIFWVALTANEASACLCKAEPASRQIARLRKQSTAIFVGKAKDVTKEMSASGRIAYRAVLEVEQSWKGAETEEITVFTDGGCMAWFEVGRTYLIYALKDDAGKLQTNICMRTGLVKYFAEDIKRLGKPKIINKRTVAAHSFSHCSTTSNKTTKESRQR